MSVARKKITAKFRPLPWQIEPWRDQSRVLLLTGGAGGGKSSIAAEKVHAYCKKYPGAVAVGLRKAREYAEKSIVYALKKAIGDDPAAKYSAASMTFNYDNGSRIFIAGMKDDQQRQAIRSINGDGSVDMIWAEEANALTEDDHNELLARLRGKAADWRQIIYTTNPDGPRHWIKLRLIDAGEASVYYSKAEDNPHNPKDYGDILGSLTGVMYQRLGLGKWVAADGMVYEEWDDMLHVIDSFPIPASWRRIRAIDFGYTNPMSIIWLAMDHDDTAYVYREMYATQKLVEDWAALIMEASAGERIEATICDHDAEGRATLNRHGIATIPADKGIEQGLQRVAARLRDQRLFVFRDALVEADPALEAAKKPTCLLQEMPGYVWPKTGDGRPVKETPVKVNDHACDALRYSVAYLDKGQPPAARPGNNRLAAAHRDGQPELTLLRTENGTLRFGYSDQVQQVDSMRSKVLRFGKN
jgi:PBSX family phage terminase large subunit